jgi:sulfate adenylyltransferase subunit 1 (EFTu-like GTPase family)
MANPRDRDLLVDARGAFEDRVGRAVARSAAVARIDFALLTDGLKAEREQGITIHVAYRYFNTERRKFIIADAPGHEQYTRNMVTGASTADLALILVDARQGLVTQSRRHAYIAHLVGIRHIIVAVNKMDLVDFRQDVYDRIASEFQAFSNSLARRSAIRSISTPGRHGCSTRNESALVPGNCDRYGDSGDHRG